MKTANVLKALKVYGILPVPSSLKPLGSISSSHKVCVTPDGVKVGWWDRDGDVERSLFLVVNIKEGKMAESATTIDGLLRCVVRKLGCFVWDKKRYHVQLIPGKSGWIKVVLLLEDYLYQDNGLVVRTLASYSDNEAISLALCLFDGTCPFEVFLDFCQDREGIDL